MKQCRLCGATCFDDMPLCYCCMHRFDEEGNDGVCNEATVVARGIETIGRGESKEGTNVFADIRTPEVDASEAAAEEGCNMEENPFSDTESDAAAEQGRGVMSPPLRPPCFAFGPTIEVLSDVGGCVRIDIPLRALSSVIAAAKAAERESDSLNLADLPPAA